MELTKLLEGYLDKFDKWNEKQPIQKGYTFNPDLSEDKLRICLHEIALQKLKDLRINGGVKEKDHRQFDKDHFKQKMQLKAIYSELWSPTPNTEVDMLSEVMNQSVQSLLNEREKQILEKLKELRDIELEPHQIEEFFKTRVRQEIDHNQKVTLYVDNVMFLTYSNKVKTDFTNGRMSVTMGGE